MKESVDKLTFETVAVTNFAAQAELIRSILEDGGFDAYVINPNVGVYLGLTLSVRVQVEASQAEAARKFLTENQLADVDFEIE